ncbi:MAG: non-heme iron oxygenase ferredoxin subunit [Acidobacteriia bacterium]|nr:non-heme iron oxygenase ferredoxin subunit [Terriglobia bacterium]
MAESIKVASISELSVGSSKTVEVQGKAIALFNVGGKIYALDNTCLHQGGPLGEGRLEGEVVTCPWHMWEFNVRTGEKVGEPSLRVATYPVQVDGDDIKVAL